MTVMLMLFSAVHALLTNTAVNSSLILPHDTYFMAAAEAAA